jgi:uncharacterized protein (UPF0332 family)
MAESWSNLAIDSLQAARTLLGRQRYRSAISRGYYAAYAALTHELARDPSITFESGRNNPGHRQLWHLVLASQQLSARFDRTELLEIQDLMNSLRSAREVADYFPQFPIDRGHATDAIRQAQEIMISKLGFPVR